MRPRSSMSMSVGLRTIGSGAKRETWSPSATVNCLTAETAGWGPMPGCLAANTLPVAKANARASAQVFIRFTKVVIQKHPILPRLRCGRQENYGLETFSDDDIADIN